MTAAPLLIGMSSRTSTPWAKEGLMSIRGNSLQVIIIAFILVNIWRLIWALSNPYHDGQDVEDISRWQSLGRPSPLAATTSDFTFTAMESDWTKAGDILLWPCWSMSMTTIITIIWRWVSGSADVSVPSYDQGSRTLVDSFYHCFLLSWWSPYFSRWWYLTLRML